MTTAAVSAPEALRRRVDDLLAERDRHFPRRDPRNTRALKAALAAYVETLRAVRDPAWRADPVRLAEARSFIDAPIVVCGFMKSGTTLLVELLDGHPELTVLPGDTHMRDPASSQRRRTEAEAYWIPRLVNPRGQVPFWFLGADDGPYMDFIGYLEIAQESLPHDDRGRFLAFVEALHCANPRRAARPRAWVEKTPENERHLDEVLRWFPTARFIHVVRDPLVNLASVKQLFLHRGWWKPWSTVTIARKLATALATAGSHRSRLGAERYHVLRYEDLVADVNAQTRELARFIGISWQETLLTPTINGMPSKPNSMFRELLSARGRVLERPAERRRGVLTATERLLASAILRPTCRRWGYA